MSMEAKEEILDIIQKMWTKLQGLPQASPLELGAFSVVILFIAMFLFMVVLTCVACCCCRTQKYQTTRIQPFEPV